MAAVLFIAGMALLVLFPPYAAGSSSALHGLMVVLALTAVALSISWLLDISGSPALKVVVLVALLLAIFILRSEPVGYADPDDMPWLVRLDRGNPYLFASVQLVSAVSFLHCLGNAALGIVPSGWRPVGRTVAGAGWAVSVVIAIVLTHGLTYDLLPGAALALAMWWQAAVISVPATLNGGAARRGYIDISVAVAGTLLLPPALMLLELLCSTRGFLWS